MKGRSLSRSRCIASLVVVSFALATAGCAGSGDAADAAELPGETITSAELAADITEPDATPAPSTTSVTTVPPTSPPTSPPTTAAPTVVETLPQPAAPPEPRADEPYLELGTLEIPKLGIAEPLLEGITLNTLDLGPGHWPGTAMPGKLGNVVIAGHRTSHGKVFRHVDQLVPGDEVILTTGDGRFVYLVTETTIVAPDAIYIVEQTPHMTATLFACHPPGSTRQRIVVHMALQVDPATNS